MEYLLRRSTYPSLGIQVLTHSPSGPSPVHQQLHGPPPRPLAPSGASRVHARRVRVQAGFGPRSDTGRRGSARRVARAEFTVTAVSAVTRSCDEYSQRE